MAPALKTAATHHLYRADPDLPADYRGQQVCVCGLAETNRIHALPDTDDAAEMDRRRLGEKAET